MIQAPFINVTLVPPHMVARGQADDYWEDEEGLHIQVGDQRNRLHNEILVVHALVEWMIAREKGVTIKQIDDWDEAHQDAEEPGDLIDCPYRDAHSLAVAIERLILAQLGISWPEFDGGLK